MPDRVIPLPLAIALSDFPYPSDWDALIRLFGDGDLRRTRFECRSSSGLAKTRLLPGFSSSSSSSSLDSPPEPASLLVRSGSPASPCGTGDAEKKLLNTLFNPPKIDSERCSPSLVGLAYGFFDLDEWVLRTGPVMAFLSSLSDMVAGCWVAGGWWLGCPGEGAGRKVVDNHDAERAAPFPSANGEKSASSIGPT